MSIINTKVTKGVKPQQHKATLFLIKRKGRLKDSLLYISLLFLEINRFDMEYFYIHTFLQFWLSPFSHHRR